MGLLRDRRGRRFFSVVKLILYQMQEFLLPLFAFVFMVAVGCVLLDNDSYAMIYYAYNWLWLILTNDTFSRLFPNLDTSSDVVSALVVFLLVYFGQGFIVNVLLGATLETYRSVSTKQIKKEKRKQKQGLVKAFTVLDPQKAGRIQQTQFNIFLHHWKPHLKPVQLSFYYEFLCAGDREGITVFQFLKIPDMFRYRFEEETIVTKQIDASQLYIQEACKQLGPYIRDVLTQSYALKLRSTLLRLKFFYYMNHVDIFLFLLQYHDKSVMSSLCPVPTFCNIVNIFYTVEFILELSFRKGDLFSLLTELRESFVCFFTIGVLGIMGLNSLALLKFYPSNGNMARILFRSFRCCRILVTNSELSAFCSSVLSVGPVFCENMVFALVILYMHGVAGHLLFGSYLDQWSTPTNATITIQKLFLPFDFLEIMEVTMKEVHTASILFFFIYFLMSIIVSNLSLSIILEWHAQMFEELSKPLDKKEESEDSHDILFKTIKERVIYRKTTKKLSFANIARAKETEEKCSKYRMYIDDKKADYRLKFVDDTEDLSEDDLKACQKYSNIDLAGFWKELNRKQKDLTWETDFIQHARKDYDIHVIEPGTTFIVKGDAASKCYLISSGTVQVGMWMTFRDGLDSLEEVEIGSINLLGSACLTPGSKYKYTCKAVTQVECLCFSQEIILTQLDSDHAGQLLRMAHKTHDALADLFRLVLRVHV